QSNQTPPSPIPIENLSGYMPVGHMSHDMSGMGNNYLNICSRQRHWVFTYVAPALVNPWQNLNSKITTIRFGTLDTPGFPPYGLTGPSLISAQANSAAVVHNNSSEIVYYSNYSSGGSNKPAGIVIGRTTCGPIYAISLIPSGTNAGVYAIIRNPSTT